MCDMHLYIHMHFRSTGFEGKVRIYNMKSNKPIHAYSQQWKGPSQTMLSREPTGTRGWCWSGSCSNMMNLKCQTYRWEFTFLKWYQMSQWENLWSDNTLITVECSISPCHYCTSIPIFLDTITRYSCPCISLKVCNYDRKYIFFIFWLIGNEGRSLLVWDSKWNYSEKFGSNNTFWQDYKQGFQWNKYSRAGILSHIPDFLA